MATNQVYLNDEEQAKLVYVQEQINKGLPRTEQKTVNQIMKEWVLERLNACDVLAHLEEDVTQQES